METPATQYLRGLQPSSRTSQRFALTRALRVLRVPIDPEQFPWHRMTDQQARVLVEGLRRDYAKSTSRTTIYAVRSVLRASKEAGVLTRTRRRELLAALEL